jgi:hypothetical protein
MPRQRAGALPGILKSGSVLLGAEPVRLVRARPGCCLLILSGWSIDRDDPDSPNIVGSGSVNVGDADVTADGTSRLQQRNIDQRQDLF